jgi:hypothetical protein
METSSCMDAHRFIVHVFVCICCAVLLFNTVIILFHVHFLYFCVSVSERHFVDVFIKIPQDPRVLC